MYFLFDEVNLHISINMFYVNLMFILFFKIFYINRLNKNRQYYQRSGQVSVNYYYYYYYYDGKNMLENYCRLLSEYIISRHRIRSYWNLNIYLIWHLVLLLSFHKRSRIVSLYYPNASVWSDLNGYCNSVLSYGFI